MAKMITARCFISSSLVVLSVIVILIAVCAAPVLAKPSVEPVPSQHHHHIHNNQHPAAVAGDVQNCDALWQRLNGSTTAAALREDGATGDNHDSSWSSRLQGEPISLH